MKFKWVFLTLVCLLLVLLIGCTTQGWFGLTSETEVVKIGLIAPLTGELASWGQNGYAGTKLAITEINANGGINGRQIELIVEDDKSLKEDSVKAINKLLFVDNVDAIIYADGSNAASATLPVLENKEIPLILTVASNPDLTNISDYVFRVYPSDTLQGKFAAEYIYNKLGKRKVALLTGQNVWAKGVSNVFKKSYAGEIVFDETTPNEQTDFKTTITKINNTDADIIYLIMYPQTILPMIGQLKESGNKLTVIGGDMFDTEEIISSKDADGSLYTVPKINSSKDLETKIKSLPEFNDLQVSLAASVAYDASYVLADALKRANSTDPESIRNALTETSYSGISNMIEFDNIGDLVSGQIEVKQIVNGKSIIYGHN